MPVLSTQRTVAEPSVSIVGTRLVKTLLYEILQAPKARIMVKTMGNSSGSTAMAIVMPAGNPCNQSPLVMP